MEYDGKTPINLKTEQFSLKLLNRCNVILAYFDHIYTSSSIVASEAFEFNGVQEQTNASG